MITLFLASIFLGSSPSIGVTSSIQAKFLTEAHCQHGNGSGQDRFTYERFEVTDCAHLFEPTSSSPQYASSAKEGLQNSTDILASCPTSENEYVTLFGEMPNLATLNATLKAVGQASQKFGVASSPGLSSRLNFTSYLQNSQAKWLIIVGHNDEGAFRFTNGDEASLQSLSDEIFQFGKRGIFITCRARHYLKKSASGLATPIGVE
jgi:hypothetical protein